jgi:hypothetical protein
MMAGARRTATRQLLHHAPLHACPLAFRLAVYGGWTHPSVRSQGIAGTSEPSFTPPRLHTTARSVLLSPGHHFAALFLILAVVEWE